MDWVSFVLQFNRIGLGIPGISGSGEGYLMALNGTQVELTNWSKSARSSCYVYQAADVAGIKSVFTAARAQRLSIIPRGAGHSYTDAALNTGAAVIDLTPMHRVLAWDAAQGIIRVEPGVTIQEMVQVAWKDGWWPFAAPSTPVVTIGGCAAMNVNGRNAWKYGPFGETILALDVLFSSGEERTLLPDRDAELFNAIIGSMGLLGMVTSITVQLQHISSGHVTVRKRFAPSLDGIFALFAEEEPASDFMEAWLDGFARGDQLGRGILTCAALSDSSDRAASPFPASGAYGRLEIPLVRFLAGLGWPVLLPGVQIFNRVHYGLERWTRKSTGTPLALPPYSFWPPAAFAGYHAMFPEGVETFQAFVPGQHAQEMFKRLLTFSQQRGCMPLWCVIKQHRRDPFLLSYQVDGFSLELNYQRTAQTAEALKQALQAMIAMVIEAGGRFYLAKDHFLTSSQYRQSMGDEAVDAFLDLKRRYDPESVLQSDLYRRVFLPM
jgi:decaprenylphospho-beta-D-ribofuranose 2-oxidase